MDTITERIQLEVTSTKPTLTNKDGKSITDNDDEVTRDNVS